MHVSIPDHRTIKHAHLFCGLGGGARGFNRATARVGSLEADFRCLGGIDVDAAAIRDFSRIAGVPGTCLDLFDREQYRAFHGSEPPPDWREATTVDIHAAFGHENPDIVFLSAPCKGFSGLLSESKSKTAKYQALNRLTLRGVWLTLEAYAQTAPIPLILFENVPRIPTRGRALLDRITALLRSYGYAVAETTHDCGELGGLAHYVECELKPVCEASAVLSPEDTELLVKGIRMEMRELLAAVGGERTGRFQTGTRTSQPSRTRSSSEKPSKLDIHLELRLLGSTLESSLNCCNSLVRAIHAARAVSDPLHLSQRPPERPTMTTCDILCHVERSQGARIAIGPLRHRRGRDCQLHPVCVVCPGQDRNRLSQIGSQPIVGRCLCAAQSEWRGNGRAGKHPG